MDSLAAILYFLIFFLLVVGTVSRICRTEKPVEPDVPEKAYHPPAAHDPQTETGPPNEILLRRQVLAGLKAMGLRFFVTQSGYAVLIILSDSGPFQPGRDVVLRLYPEDQVISFSACMIDELKDEDLQAMAELCHRLNRDLLVGRFELDYAEGKVYAVIHYHLFNAKFEQHLQNYFLSRLLQYKIDYQPAFHRVKNDKELPFLAALVK